MTGQDTPEVAATTVLIAGAGPAGLAAAAELALHGIDCVVIEPRVTVEHDRPRAKTTSVRTMEQLRRWGIADALRAAAPLPVAWSQRVTFCGSLAGPRLTDFDNAFGLTTEVDERFAEAGQQVPQPVVEEVLRAHVGAQPGIGLRLGHTVTSLHEEGSHVTVWLTDDAGRPYRLTASYVLGCDGPRSVVRDRIGSRLVGRSDPRPNFNLTFYAPTLDTSLGPAVQYWVVGSKTSGLIGRLDRRGTWWAIFPGVDLDYGTAHSAELIAGLAGGPVDHKVLATDPWAARMLVTDRFQQGRVFLVGESAHLNPPWGGHGFNTCVGDAVNIAWKIAAVAQGWAGPALLDSYETERRGVVEQTVSIAETNMARLAADLSTDVAEIRRSKRSEFYSLGLVLGYSYAGSPVVQPAPPAPMTDVSTYTPAADPGARLPHHWLRDGSSLYDHLGTGLTLLRPTGVVTAALESQATSLGIPLTVIDSPGSYPWRDELLVVRPDQHIAWRALDPGEIDLPAVVGLRFRS